MSLILAFDTSSVQSSIGLFNDEVCLSETTLDHGRNLSRVLVPTIEQLCLQANRTLRQLDAVAVCTGPGSFTGLRIGVTTAKTLAFALSKPVIPLSTLQVLAEGVTSEPGDRILALLDARRDEVFAARFTASPEGMLRLGEDEVIPITKLSSFALPEGSDYDGRLIVAGPLAPNFDHLSAEYRFFHCFPQARDAARLAVAALREGRVSTPLEVEPFYLRRSYAEEKSDAP